MRKQFKKKKTPQNTSALYGDKDAGIMPPGPIWSVPTEQPVQKKKKRKEKEEEDS